MPTKIATIFICDLKPLDEATLPSLPAVDLIESPSCANLSLCDAVSTPVRLALTQATYIRVDIRLV